MNKEAAPMSADPSELSEVEKLFLRRSLTDKLQTEAKRRGVTVPMIRKQYVFTLFLRRLFTEDSGQWTLLGGNALLIRTGGGRFTSDIDLARSEPWDEPDQVLHELRTRIEHNSGLDPFEFKLSSITPHRQVDPFGYGTATAKISAEACLGVKCFEAFSIDLTTKRHLDGPVDRVQLLPVIDHPTLQCLPEVPTVPVENHLADKICALYEKHRGKPSTRYRDLADVVQIVRQLSFGAGKLDEVIGREAGRRQIDRPLKMVAPDDSWKQAYPKAAKDFAEFPAGLYAVQASLALAGECLNDVLASRRTQGVWDPDHAQWN